MLKKIFIMSFLIACIGQTANAEAYINDLRNLFLNNKAIIMAVNLRTFNAKDTDKNGLIDENEEKGTFLNAIERLGYAH